MVIANNTMPTRPIPSSKNMPADDDSKASADSPSKRDPVVKEITPESRVSTCSTLAVDAGSEASADSKSKRDPVVNKIMPASRVSSSSTMPVDVVSKAPALRWSKQDPTHHWLYNKSLYKFFLAAGPQNDYRFPPYLGYADSGPFRVGAAFSSPFDLNTFLGAPEVMPEDSVVFSSPARTFRDRSLTWSFFSPTAERKFSFQQLEHHMISPNHLEGVIDVSVWNKTKPRRIYIITGLKIAEGLKVSDGESRWKFDDRVILSYRMEEVR